MPPPRTSSTTLSSLPGAKARLPATGQITRHSRAAESALSPRWASTIGAPPRCELGQHAAGRTVGRPVQHRSHAPAHGRHSPDVVLVEVREHQQIDARDADAIEARGERLGRGPGVDEHDGIPAERSSTASPWPTSHASTLHVAGNVHRPATDVRATPPALVPATTATTQQRTPRRCRSRRAASDLTATSAPIATPSPASSAAPRPSLHPRDEVAGNRRHGLRRRRDPRRRHPRERGEAGLQHRHRGGEAGREPDDRRHRCGGRGQQVGEHPVDRHDRADEHEQRPARELRGERHRQRECERARQSARQAVRERACEQQKGCRRRRRQREPQ